MWRSEYRSMYVMEFDDREDGGPMLVGPFATREAAYRWAADHAGPSWSGNVRPLTVPDAL